MFPKILVILGVSLFIRAVPLPDDVTPVGFALVKDPHQDPSTPSSSGTVDTSTNRAVPLPTPPTTHMDHTSEGNKASHSVPTPKLSTSDRPEPMSMTAEASTPLETTSNRVQVTSLDSTNGPLKSAHSVGPISSTESFDGTTSHKVTEEATTLHEVTDDFSISASEEAEATDKININRGTVSVMEVATTMPVGDFTEEIVTPKPAPQPILESTTLKTSPAPTAEETAPDAPSAPAVDTPASKEPIDSEVVEMMETTQNPGIGNADKGNPLEDKSGASSLSLNVFSFLSTALLFIALK